METKKATSFNYETYVVHVEITSKVNFVEHQSAKSIEDIVLKAINFDSIDNTIVKSFVKSFLSSVNYESIAKYVNESLEGKEISNNPRGWTWKSKLAFSTFTRINEIYEAQPIFHKK